jgi:hypothetical protein
MKKLEDLRWVPRWVSHLGCLKGCLDYLKVDVSDAWLYGATGHAFIINIHSVVCPSGPTAWRTEPILRLGLNIGCRVDGVFGHRSAGDFAETQARAWRHVRDAIDDGLPCYGWELEVPEYYVVYGYGDGAGEAAGYCFSGPGCDDGGRVKPWRKLGDTGIGVVEMFSVRPAQAAGDVRTVREALAFALEHATGPEKWIFPDYRAGMAGYDAWVSALEGGTADGFGVAYNAAVWSECRNYAVQFLREARERLEGQAIAEFDQAGAHYSRVAENLKAVAESFPFHGLEPGHIRDGARVRGAVQALEAARAAEALGLSALQAIVDQL